MSAPVFLNHLTVGCTPHAHLSMMSNVYPQVQAYSLTYHSTVKRFRKLKINTTP